MPAPVSIAGTKIKPGQHSTIHMPVARLYTHTEMTMPITSYTAAQKGRACLSVPPFTETRSTALKSSGD